MALFVSKYREYELGIQPTRAVPNQFTGERVVHQKGITAKFKWAGRGLEPWALDQALNRFQFTGLTYNEDPLRRLSFFDTEAELEAGTFDDAARVASDNGRPMTPEDVHTYVVEVMRSKQNDAYFEAERPQLSAPWPNYDKMTNAKAIANTVDELGLDIGYAISYEQQNENRKAVIDALNALAAQPEVEDEVEVTA